jgi:hypothetical protein
MFPHYLCHPSLPFFWSSHYYPNVSPLHVTQVSLSFEVPITTPMFPCTHLIEYQEQKIKLIVANEFNLDFFPWVALEFLCLGGGACLSCVLSPMGNFFFAKNNKNADQNTTFALTNFSSNKTKRSVLSKANTMLNLYTYLCKTSEFVSKPDNTLCCVVV